MSGDTGAGLHLAAVVTTLLLSSQVSGVSTPEPAPAVLMLTGRGVIGPLFPGGQMFLTKPVDTIRQYGSAAPAAPRPVF